MKKLIAKTEIGSEYLHSRQDAFFAAQNADIITDVLNRNKYQIKEGEKWHIYEYDCGMDMYVYRRIYISGNRSIKIAIL